MPHTALIASQPQSFTYGHNVTLQCFAVLTAEPHHFTWTGPSDSVESGSIVSGTQSSTLTFVAMAEYSGPYTCQINGTTASPAITTVTVGNRPISVISTLIS